jgi:hypothetical protein
MESSAEHFFRPGEESFPRLPPKGSLPPRKKRGRRNPSNATVAPGKYSMLSCVPILWLLWVDRSPRACPFSPLAPGRPYWDAGPSIGRRPNASRPLHHTSKYDGSICEKYRNMMAKSVKCNSYIWPVLRGASRISPNGAAGWRIGTLAWVMPIAHKVGGVEGTMTPRRVTYVARTS